MHKFGIDGIIATLFRKLSAKETHDFEFFLQHVHRALQFIVVVENVIGQKDGKKQFHLG